MENFENNFTNAELERINQLYGNNFENITPEDAQLIGRWESAKALAENTHQERINAIRAETELKLQLAVEQSTQAMQNLQELHDLAIARLENVSNGQ